MSRKVFFAMFVVLFVLALLPGCMPIEGGEGGSGTGFAPTEAESVLEIVLDLSGSYQGHMLGEGGQEGHAFRLAKKVIADFFQGREMSEDRIIFAQISGKGPSLLFDGTPAAFQERFPDSERLKQFLLEKTDPAGSPIHKVITESLTYLNALHRQKPDLKSCVVIFSDFEDTDPKTEQTREEMAKAFREYAKVAGDRGAVGCYWVDLAYVPGITKILQDSGLKPSKWIVENGINASPRPPQFD
jgi:hypothetical protein